MHFRKNTKSFTHRVLNLPGWHTHRKIVVIDSDDWGSVALPSKEVLERLTNSGFNITLNPYLKYDSLAGESDLSALFDLLDRYKDKNGRHPVITANTVVGNPDFNRIRESGFNEYHYELFTETLKRYPHHSGSFTLWKQGIDHGLFYPQFHAREHLNVAYWMQALRDNNPLVHLGFDNNVYIFDNSINPAIKHSCASAFYAKSQVESDSIKTIVKDGLHRFREVFGYSSDSFTGTGYIWETSLEKVLKEEGVKYLKGLTIQREPVKGSEKLRNRYHYTGQKGKYGQLHLVRNAFFEPGLDPQFDWTGDCLERMGISFRSGKPVILSTHRINFIGSIDENFRTRNLASFETLLKEMLRRYPDIEFMTSSELGNMILNKNN
jgi:hypothetical protein